MRDGNGSGSADGHVGAEHGNGRTGGEGNGNRHHDCRGDGDGRSDGHDNCHGDRHDDDGGSGQCDVGDKGNARGNVNGEEHGNGQGGGKIGSEGNGNRHDDRRGDGDGRGDGSVGQDDARGVRRGDACDDAGRSGHGSVGGRDKAHGVRLGEGSGDGDGVDKGGAHRDARGDAMGAVNGDGREDERTGDKRDDAGSDPVDLAAAERALMRRYRGLSPVGKERVRARVHAAALEEFGSAWSLNAHAGQFEPPGAWRVWLIRAGRGFGKTRAGAEWVSQFARDHPDARIALVGDTAPDVAKVMVEGTSGLIAVARAGERLRWSRIRGEVRFPSGAVAQVYSANAPEGLRGPEHHAAWCDELGKWKGSMSGGARGGDAAWDNLLLGLRLGERPRVVVTTTPRPNPLMRRVMRARGTVETRGATRDNPHLPGCFVAEMEDQYGGTRLGRQELDGEMVEDVAGALWTRAMIEACRTEAACDAVRTVVGVDPPASAGGDACGIVAAGIDGDGIVHVLEDASVAGETPEGWARAVAACAHRHGADRVVAESNQGGDMVRSVLWAADATLPVRKVHAARGKSARAEPVAALYARGRVRHHGRFPALEDELCGLVAGGGYEGPGRSPDRADALVWAVAELAFGRRGDATVRGL